MPELTEIMTMDILFPTCAGLDVHKATIVACLRTVQDGKAVHEIRNFSTMTSALLELSEWLSANQCTHVAMEATGVYWKPVWHVLESDFELVLANAAHIRNVPGRKSDVNDATWIADLLAHGLIRSSFVPPRPIQELRDLTRTRKQLRREIVQHTQRLQRVLEDANVKLDSVISDILGQSGRSMLRAIIAGESDPEKLADLGHPRLRCSRRELVEALRGMVTPHHRFLLRQHLRMVEELERTMADFDAQIEGCLAPFVEAVDRLTTIPGISRLAAEVLVAEIGVDMSRFQTVGHLLSWAGMCPRMDESAGKHRSNRLRKGDVWLKQVLVQCAWAAARSKDTYLKAQFLRIKSRRGPKKAAVAVGASILTAAYFMLRDGTSYNELGGDYFLRRDETRVAYRLTQRLKALGYEVEIRKAA